MRYKRGAAAWLSLSLARARARARIEDKRAEERMTPKGERTLVARGGYGGEERRSLTNIEVSERRQIARSLPSSRPGERKFRV